MYQKQMFRIKNVETFDIVTFSHIFTLTKIIGKKRPNYDPTEGTSIQGTCLC